MENNIISRLNFALGAIKRDGRPIKQRQVAIDLGYTRESTVSEIVNGKRDMSPKFIKAFCATYAISEEWLTEGVGEMFIEDEPNPQRVRPSAGVVTFTGHPPAVTQESNELKWLKEKIALLEKIEAMRAEIQSLKTQLNNQK